MSAMLTSDGIAMIVFGVVMLPIAGYVFQNVCSMCGADPPTFGRSVLVTVLVAVTAFFTFDGLGYGIALAGRDTIHLPPGYTYWNWLREPLYLKWQALGLIPLLRWLPVLVAVCLAATLYVLILAEPFRNCIAILAIQWTLNVVAMAILSFALSNILHVIGPPSLSSPVPEAAQSSGLFQVPAEVRAATRPKFPHSPRSARPKALPENKEPVATGADLKSTLAAQENVAGPAQGRLPEQLHALEERLGPYLEPIKEACAPYTKYLPAAAQEFLDDGGWWLVLIALVVAAACWLRSLGRRVKRIVFPSRHRKRRGRGKGSPLAIDLDLIGDAFTDPGPQQITVRSQPGRLRLVVLAPSPSYIGDLEPEMADSLLDWIHPGLGDILEFDKPRRVVWPRFPSLNHFVQMFHRLVQIPEAKGRRSPWMLISGSTRLGRQTIFLGLAVFLDKTSYQRTVQVVKEKWNEVLGMQEVREPV
jgi:hypothetical protein